MIKTPNDTTFSKKSQYELQEWGSSDWKVIQKKLKQKRVCLDIGAHIGLTSIRYSKNFEQVHCFEPIMCEYLEENTKELSNITIHKVAVTDKKSTLKIYPNQFNSGSNVIESEESSKLISTRWKKLNSRHFGTIPMDVEGISVDSLNIKNVDCIKIDVEGYNIPVLKGMINTLKENSPVIQVETHPENTEVEITTNKILTELGYKRYHKSNGTPPDWFYYKD